MASKSTLAVPAKTAPASIHSAPNSIPQDDDLVETNMTSLWNYTEAGYARILKSLKVECNKENVEPVPEFTVEAYGWIRVLCGRGTMQQILRIWHSIIDEIEEEHVNSFGGERALLNPDGSLKPNMRGTYIFGPKSIAQGVDPLAPDTEGARAADKAHGFPPKFTKFTHREKWTRLEQEKDHVHIRYLFSLEEIEELNSTGDVIVSWDLHGTLAYVGAETDELLKKTMRKLDNTWDRFMAPEPISEHCFMLADTRNDQQDQYVDLRYMAHIQEKQLTTTLLDDADAYPHMYEGGVRFRLCPFDAKKDAHFSLFGPKIKDVQLQPPRRFRWGDRPAVHPKSKVNGADIKAPSKIKTVLTGNAGPKLSAAPPIATAPETAETAATLKVAPAPGIKTSPAINRNREVSPLAVSHSEENTFEASQSNDKLAAPDRDAQDISHKESHTHPLVSQAAAPESRNAFGELLDNLRVSNWVMDVPDVLEPIPAEATGTLDAVSAQATAIPNIMDMDIDPVEKLALEHNMIHELPQSSDRLDETVQSIEACALDPAQDLLGDGSPEKRELERLITPKMEIEPPLGHVGNSPLILSQIGNLPIIQKRPLDSPEKPPIEDDTLGGQDEFRFTSLDGPGSPRLGNTGAAWQNRSSASLGGNPEEDYAFEIEVGGFHPRVVDYDNMDDCIENDRPIPRRFLGDADVQPPRPSSPEHVLISIDEQITTNHSQNDVNHPVVFSHFRQLGSNVRETMRQAAASKPNGPVRVLPSALKSFPIPPKNKVKLSRLFDKAPYFRGTMEFKIDLGKVILRGFDETALATNNEGERSNGWKMEQSRDLLNKFCLRPQRNMFTTILTSHESDVEAMVNAKFGKSGSSRLWASEPTSVRTIYSFTCYCNSEGNEQQFVVDIEHDAKGGQLSYSIRKLSNKDAALWVHSLMNTWDFRMRLARSNTSELLKQFGEFAEQLAESFTATLVSHVGEVCNCSVTFVQVLTGHHRSVSEKPGKPTYCCTYDLPAGFDIIVRGFQVITKWRYLGTDNSTALDISEILQMERSGSPETSHWVCREWSPELVEMKQASGLVPWWYEASISSLKLETVLSENQALGVFERARWSMPDIERCLEMVHSQAVRLVKCMDNIGAGEDNAQMRKYRNILPKKGGHRGHGHQGVW